MDDARLSSVLAEADTPKAQAELQRARQHANGPNRETVNAALVEKLSFGDVRNREILRSLPNDELIKIAEFAAKCRRHTRDLKSQEFSQLKSEIRSS